MANVVVGIGVAKLGMAARASWSRASSIDAPSGAR